MTLRGLSLGDERDTGGCIVTPFGVVPGRERQAGRDVLACLAGGLEVSLSNDLDEGGEGSTAFCRTRSGLARQGGGARGRGGGGPAPPGHGAAGAGAAGGPARP